jgi:hypothetical protein
VPGKLGKFLVAPPLSPALQGLDEPLGKLVGGELPFLSPALLPRFGEDFLGDRRGDLLPGLRTLDSGLAGFVGD